MDNSHDRLIFDPVNMNRIYYHSWKEHLKISKIVKFGGKILQMTENLTLRNLRILYIFVLRAEKSTTFEPNMVGFSARNTNIIQKFANFGGVYFPLFTTFCH